MTLIGASGGAATNAAQDQPGTSLPPSTPTSPQVLITHPSRGNSSKSPLPFLLHPIKHRIDDYL